MVRPWNEIDLALSSRPVERVPIIQTKLLRIDGSIHLSV